MGISLSGLTQSSTGNLTLSAASGNDVLIGNGSKVVVEFAILEVLGGPAKGKNKAFIRNVQIIDLIPYEGSGGGSSTFTKRDDGFSSSSNAYLEEQLA